MTGEISGGQDMSTLAANRQRAQGQRYNGQFNPDQRSNGQFNSDQRANGNFNNGKKDFTDYKRQKLDRKCDYCNVKGHTMDVCFKLHGYPDWYKEYKEKMGDHKAVANSANQMETPFDFDHEDKSKGSVVGNSGNYDTSLVNAVCQEVLRAIKGKEKMEFSANFVGITFAPNALHAQAEFDDHDWVIDTGATYHMCFNHSLFHGFQQLLKPIMVGLPDGTIKKVTKVGDIVVTDDIVLHSVLYIPEFRHNLLSVSKLMDDTNFMGWFSKTSYYFQDLTTKRITTRGERIGGLYRF